MLSGLCQSESWTKLFHYTVQSCFQTFWETQDWWFCSCLRTRKCWGRLLFRLQRRKSTQAALSFIFISTLILPFTNVILQLNNKYLLNYLKNIPGTHWWFSHNIMKVLAKNVQYIILSKNLGVYKTIRYLKASLWQILTARTMFCYSCERASRSFDP